MKMNFGKWIVVAFILFAAFIGTLVTVCVREDISLVSKEYYKEELAYQDQIVRINNTSQLFQKPVIKVAEGNIEVSFNELKTIEKGELKLFRPSDSRMDKTFSLQSTKDTKQSFDIHNLEKGMYRARFQWSMEGKEFYMEEIIYI